MPSDQDIAARIAVIRARLADYARSFPSAAFAITDDELRDQAIAELTGLPAPSPAETSPGDTHLDDRYVQIG